MSVSILLKTVSYILREHKEMVNKIFGRAS